MPASDLIGPAVVAAVVSGAVSILGNLFSNRASRDINNEKIASEKELAERKFGFEVDLAERRFRYEQSIHNYRRTVEFGEELLATFYKLRDMVRSVRGPFSWGDESAGRQRRPGENEDEARRRDGYYAPIARIQKNTEFSPTSQARNIVHKPSLAATFTGHSRSQSALSMVSALPPAC